MTIVEAVLFAALVLAAAPIGAATGYLALLTLFSRAAPPPAPPRRLPRVDVIVPAHDEELHIADTVRSLMACEYPADLRRVIVVADNCTDATATRAEQAGALVWSRTEPELRGKGYALAHGFARSMENDFAEFIMVVDADSIVSSNLLQAGAARISSGEHVLQADYAVRNAEASWRTRLMAVAFGMFHRLRSRARERLHLSCGLRGNGMGFSTAVLRAIPYQAYSLVEDVEYGLRLGEAGRRVAYVAEGHVYGEMVTSEGASRSQRDRWERGRRGLARQAGLRLLREGLRERRPMLIDLAIDLLLPPFSRIAVATVGALLTACLLSRSVRGAGILVAVYLWCALLCTAYVIRGWALSGTGLAGLRDLLLAPLFVVWKVRLLVTGRRHAGSWQRTARGERPGRDRPPV